MLILTRKTGDVVLMGPDDPITIKVLDNDGIHVRLGIEAPSHVRIVRREIQHRYPIDSTESSRENKE